MREGVGESLSASGGPRASLHRPAPPFSPCTGAASAAAAAGPGPSPRCQPTRQVAGCAPTPRPGWRPSQGGGHPPHRAGWGVGSMGSPAQTRCSPEPERGAERDRLWGSRDRVPRAELPRRLPGAQRPGMAAQVGEEASPHSGQPPRRAGSPGRTQLPPLPRLRPRGPAFPPAPAPRGRHWPRERPPISSRPCPYGVPTGPSAGPVSHPGADRCPPLLATSKATSSGRGPWRPGADWHRAAG